MPPLVLKEEQVFSFKFWFNDKIRYGMYYRSELFCRLASFDVQQRAQVYQLGAKLSQQDVLVALTCSAERCTLWGSLRSSAIKTLLLHPENIKLARSNGVLNPDVGEDSIKD